METLNSTRMSAQRAAALLSLFLMGCATAQAPSNPPAGSAAAPASAASAPAAAPRPAPLPGALPPFAEITREAKRSDGFLPVWNRDDRYWLEVPAALLDKPFFLGGSIARGQGDSRFWPGLTTRAQLVVLQRVGNNLHLVARNLAARAPAGTPLGQAVSESYADSLLAAAPLVAAPHLQSKALLVDAAALLGGDLAGFQTTLEASYRLSYAHDRGNSHIERLRTQPTGTTLTLRQHFALPRLPAPPAPGSTAPAPTLPDVPDARSLFLAVSYTLAPLPTEPLRTRRADPRVGHLTTAYIDFGDDTSNGRRAHLIRRWRLQKADPAAAVSKPREPIRVVMDRNIPLRWREPIRSGLLEWNKAFERAGFRDALVVEQQAADADWSTLEGTRHIAVRWFAQDGPGSTAVGPSQSDPRTGEILRGAVIIDENRVRLFRTGSADTQPRLPPAPAQAEDFCEVQAGSFDDAALGLELMSLRGDFDPSGPQGEAFVAGQIKQVTMHELGHVLGLRHNFRASTGITLAQLRDPAYTRVHGLSPSVMEYHATNTPLQGEPIPEYHMSTLGAYDLWAIEYAYREFPDDETEKRELARLAALGETDPRLAYATDGDSNGFDPLVNQRDMSDDPLGFAERRIQLARELWRRTQDRSITADEHLTRNLRNLQGGFGMMAQAVPWVLKYVGGSFTERATAVSGKALVTPVPPAQQRRALDLVVREVLAPGAFRFDPAFMSRLGTDTLERGAAGDYSLPASVASLQRTVLDHLTSEALAVRLADAESKMARNDQLLNFAEVQQRLSDAVWTELAAAKPGALAIDSLRRNLQREHVRRLATALLRPSAAADLRPVLRQAAAQLQARLQAALAGKPAPLIRAHLDDSLATLTEALKAPLVKQGV